MATPPYPSSEQLRREPARGRGRATVERLLSAADELISRDGAGALGTKQVAAAAGVSIGTVYNWFPDKESIAEALSLRYWSELGDLVAAVADAPVAPEDPIGELIEALAAGFRARPGLLALWFGGLLTEQLRDATRPLRTEVAASIDRILAAVHPETDPEQRAPVARTVVLIGDGLLREAFRLDPEGDPSILEEGRAALKAYVAARLGPGVNIRPGRPPEAPSR